MEYCHGYNTFCENKQSTSMKPFYSAPSRTHFKITHMFDPSPTLRRERKQKSVYKQMPTKPTGYAAAS